MAFIKVGDTVINTDTIIAVEFARTAISGKTYVVVTVTTGGLFRKTREFWFTGEAANSLKEYFADPNNVTELLPSTPERAHLRSGRVQRVRARSRVQSREYEPLLEPPVDTNWDDDENDDDAPPPPPTIRRRPWEPQPPSPLTAMADVEQFNPPVP